MFPKNIDAYNVTAETTLPSVGLENLTGKYVYVESELDGSSWKLVTLTTLDDSRFGKVSEITKSSITIDETTYPLTVMLSPNVYVGNYVLYHIYKGSVVGLVFLAEKSGVLEEWYNINNQLTISGSTFLISELTDKSFLANLDQLLGWTISYFAADGYVLRVTQVDNRTEEKNFQRYDDISRTVYFMDGNNSNISKSYFYSRWRDTGYK